MIWLGYACLAFELSGTWPTDHIDYVMWKPLGLES